MSVLWISSPGPGNASEALFADPLRSEHCRPGSGCHSFWTDLRPPPDTTSSLPRNMSNIVAAQSHLRLARHHVLTSVFAALKKKRRINYTILSLSNVSWSSHQAIMSTISRVKMKLRHRDITSPPECNNTTVNRTRRGRICRWARFFDLLYKERALTLQKIDIINVKLSPTIFTSIFSSLLNSQALVAFTYYSPLFSIRTANFFFHKIPLLF